MSDPAVLIAVRDHLSAIADLPAISWPNSALPENPPFLIFDNGPAFGRPITIDGEERFEFRPLVSYMERQGDYTFASDAALFKIAQAFSFATKIMSGSSEVAHCLQTPVADNGYHDGTYYRRTMTLQIASYQQI